MFASRLAPQRLAWLLLMAGVPAAAQTIPASRADLNGDCVVTRADVSIAQASVNKRCGQAGFNALADVNGDCVVNTIDTTFIARLVGRTVCEATPPPTIAAAVSPLPNASGWNNTGVTVSFTCTNATACPATVTIATEGANQLVERSVTNAAGQSATARVTLNIDRTPPLVTIAAPSSASPGQSVPVSVSVADLAGVPSVELFDTGTSVGSDDAAPYAFTYAVPSSSTRGSGRVLFARAQDRAGNWGSTEVTLRVDVPDTTLPLVRIDAPASGAPDELVPVIVSASDDQRLVRLTLSRDGTELRSATVDPFTFQLNEKLPHAGGPVTYVARAEDASGNVAVTEAVVQVTPGGATVSSLEVHVVPPVSPTFQTSTVLSGTIGAGVALPAARRAFLAGVSPAEARQGATLDVSVGGANTQFVANDTLLTFGPGITVEQVQVVSPTQVTARITVARDAGVGPRIVVATAGQVEAALINAFTVRVGTTRLTGRATNAAGGAIAGAQVCVPGTSLCTVTGADGTFAFDDAPLDATRVVLTASGFVKSSVPVKLDSEGTSQLGDLQLADADVPPPPPPPNGPAITAGVAKSLGLGASEFPKPGPQNFDALVRMVRDTIVAVGGSEVGVFDEDGHQLNPAVTGAGYASYRHHAVEALAWRQAGGEVTTLGETLATILLSFQYSNPALVPRLASVLAALQNEVNAAWTSPSRPGAPLMFVLFNQGRAPLATAPTLSLDTPLNELQKQLLISSFLTFRYREFVEPGTVAALGGADAARPWLGPGSAFVARVGDFALMEGPAAFGLGGPRFVKWTPPAQGGGGATPSREVSQPWINVYSEVAGPQFRSTLYGTMGKLCGEVTKTAALTPLAPKDSKFGMRDVILQAVPKCPEVVKLASNVFYTQFADVLDREKAFYNLFKREGVTTSMQSAASVALQGNRPNKYEIFPDGTSRQLQTGLSAETKKLLGKIQDAKLENEALTTFRRQAFSQLATKNYQDSVLYQDWQKAKNEARKMNLVKNGVSVVRGMAEGFFGMAEGVAFGAIMDLEVDLILQSLRPRPPLILDARQVRDPDTDVPAPAVAVIFERSDNDHLMWNEENVVWSYELWRQTGSSIYRVAVQKAATGSHTATREMVMYDVDAPPGTHLYRVVARRRVGGPIEYAPTDFDNVYAPLIGALVPGMSGMSTPAGTFTPGGGTANGGVVKFSSGVSFGALKTALDPMAKTLKGLAYQVSDPSDALGVNVVTRIAPPPVGKLAIDPFGRRSYLSLPSFGRIFQASPSFTTYTDTGFAPSPGQGFHAGLGVDRFGHLYVDNVASNNRFGGRIFRYKYPTGERELVGSVNYYSQLLQFANAVGVSDIAAGPYRGVGEVLYIADAMNQRITTMTLPEDLPPGVTTGRNISQPYASSPLFDFPASTSLVVRQDGTIFFNQYDNIVKVPPQYFGGASYTPSYLFRPGTSLFTNTTGMAGDVFGNLYVTDASAGTITMLPWTRLSSQFTGDNITPVERKLFTLARGLSNPQGVAVLPFSRGLAYFDAERAYATISFGFSAVIRDAAGNPLPNATVLVPDRSGAAVSDGDGVVVLPDLLVEGAGSTVNYIIRHEGKAQSGTLALTPGVHNILELTFDPAPDAGPVVPVRLVTAPLPGPPSGRQAITPNGRNVVVASSATIPGIRAATGTPVPGPLDVTCPAASIVEPATRSLADDDNLTVRGTVSPRALDHVLLDVNGVATRVAVNADGTFSLPVTLASAKSAISVTLDAPSMASFGCNVGNASGDDRVTISQPVDVLSPSRNPVDATIASFGYANTIRGQVVDKESGLPIVGLPVSVVGGSDHGTTDRFGVFQLNTTFADYGDAVDYANGTVTQTIAELDLLASTLRAGQEAAAMDQIEMVLNSINRITYDQSPVAAANARKLLATLDAVGKILTRVVQAIEDGADVAPADVDAIQQAANDLGPWQSVNSIEVTSSEAPDLSILIKVRP